MNAKSIDSSRIHHQVSDDPGKPGLRTATMHRVKGLAFNAIIIAGVNDGIVPLAVANMKVDSDYAVWSSRPKNVAFYTLPSHGRNIMS